MFVKLRCRSSGIVRVVLDDHGAKGRVAMLKGQRTVCPGARVAAGLCG